MISARLNASIYVFHFHYGDEKTILSSKPVRLLVMGHGLLNFCFVTKGRVCLWGSTARSHLAPLSLSFVFQDLFNKP